MATISEFLDALLDEGKDFARGELKAVIRDAKSDNRLFIKHMGELTEEFIELRALNKISNLEFKNLMKDVVYLNKLQYHKLSVEAKTRAEKISNSLSDLVTNKLLALI